MAALERAGFAAVTWNYAGYPALLSRELAQAGLTVVSGLALGIDGVAHRAALENAGRTIAVLAGDLDRVYPKDHTGLFAQIQEMGAFVSEQPLGVRPDSRSFPRRNRLISGLSLGSVVIEVAEGSGPVTRSTTAWNKTGRCSAYRGVSSPRPAISPTG